MILLLHHRYRHAGGEERAVEDLAWLIREHLGEDVEVLQRDSATVGRRAAAPGCWRVGCGPRGRGGRAADRRARRARAQHGADVRLARTRTTRPTFGWRALAAAREAGARVVLHLHNYRLVCAVGTCFTPRRGLHALPRPQHAARACG